MSNRQTQTDRCDTCEKCKLSTASSDQQFQSAAQQPSFNQTLANRQNVPVNVIGLGQPTGQQTTGGSENLGIYSQQAGYLDPNAAGGGQTGF